MKPSLQLKIGQHLTMTPQLQQAIRLLQLSSLDLQQEVQEALDANPLLEMDEARNDDGIETNQSLSDDAPYSTDDRSSLTDSHSSLERNESINSQSELDSGPLSTRSEETAVDFTDTTMPDELPVDTHWDDVFDGALSSAGSSAADDDDYNLDARNSQPESLQDTLMWQLNLTPMSPLDQVIAISIIEAIDERGYLRQTVEEIRDGILQQQDVVTDIIALQHQELLEIGIDPASLTVEGEAAITLEEVLAVLHRIQQFDPPGVGARDLKECLLIQLNQLAPDTPFLANAKEVVAKYLDALASRDFALLLRKTKLSEFGLKEVIKLIRTLKPHPGAGVGDDNTEYVIPDVIVRKFNGRWQVELNPEATPRLRINGQYAGLVQRGNSSDDNTFLRNHLQEARWFIKSLLSRNETLLKVASKIVEYQIEFFEEGEEFMKPLVLHDIAEAVGMHESTISRVTTQKFMHTPRGVFELKYFFSSHVNTQSGGEASSTAIRAIIKKLIAEENPRKPLSDSKITEMLAERDIVVARRTIAKYREALAIPPSNERKRLV
ncbi:DNA-directed RNA polymerase specialized sigma subunit, sigma54 homolog [gamma proteobacterium HdN1]|nr:DNA-directed RNA polymerase specialized sigma subunit, sigma54 homolog [gamma proteobacterium HdN1]